MDSQIQVLCDVHLEPMEFVIYLWAVSSVDKWEKPFFRCNEAGCLRHFTPSQGYVDLDGQIYGETRKIRFCSNNPKHYGSVAIVGLDQDEPIWKCIHKDCVPEVRSPFVGSVFALG
jgi:hypothetical protein